VFILRCEERPEGAGGEGYLDAYRASVFARGALNAI
jgi:hypothetical protein